jgi:predicted MFS family arabinose efflux permease
LFSANWTAAYIAYALTGFFLSMIYAPMSKLVTENTEPLHAVRCSIAYGFASYFGSPVAGVAAALVSWQGAFGAASGSLIAIGVIGFVLFTAMEKQGQIRYGQFQPPKEKGGGVKLLLKRQIVTFTLVAILTGVVRTTVVFWMPTYFVQYLHFTEEQSALIFTVATLAICANSFLAVFLYEKLFRQNTNLATMVYFVVAAAAFAAMIVVREPIGNIVLMILAILAANCASTILWSCYCISLRDTGLVSGATGFLDFASYMAASVASTAFANALPSIGWSGLVVSWFVLMAIGAVVTVPYRRRKA